MPFCAINVDFTLYGYHKAGGTLMSKKNIMPFSKVSLSFNINVCNKDMKGTAIS
jgi:hypothetical protein